MKKIFAVIAIVLVVFAGGLYFVLNNTDANSIDAGLIAYNDRDYKTALSIWQPLAKQGNLYAQFYLGLMYDKGHGVLQDYSQAEKWYRLAAEKGVAKAQFNLGAMHKLNKNYKEAGIWYSFAAEQGLTEGQYSLGSLYRWGKEVSRDYVRAHMWLNLATSNGDISAEYSRDSLADDMTSEQLAEAKKRAKQCKATNYKEC